MTFLEPLMLIGLPLALLPIIIHLLNKLRHRSVKWAAMMFLLSANKTATRQAKIRQWLILLMRALAVAAIVFVVSRPIAGGWLGWAFQGAPDAIVVVLDRSLSMEAKLNGKSKRESAIELVANSARAYQGKSHIVLIDSALRIPQELTDVGLLSRLSFTSATDTSADIISTLESSIDWIQRNKPGSVEIWIASDFQKSNWSPDSERWKEIIPRLSAVAGNLRVRLLRIANPQLFDDVGIVVSEAIIKKTSSGKALEIELEIERTSIEEKNLPVNLLVDGEQQYFEIPCQGQSMRYRHRIMLGKNLNSGWGKVEVPADANLRNNVTYFVYNPLPMLKVAVVSSNTIGGKILTLASAPLKADTNRVAELILREKADSVNFMDYALVIWQGQLPDNSIKLRDYIESGGVVVLFGSGGKAASLEGVSLSNIEDANNEKPFKVTKWYEKDGILARTEEGLSIPLNELLVYKRQPLNGGNAIAYFEDGSAFITRRMIGRGQLVICATTVEPEWSNLRDGTVLVPLIQRLFDAGARRITQSDMVVCGENTLNVATQILPIEGSDYKINAGVYKVDGKLVAVNHSPDEDVFEIVDETVARKLFTSVPVAYFEEKTADGQRFQSEIWRTFLIAMVMFLIIESILVLPPKS